jgi:hypothetical protein
MTRSVLEQLGEQQVPQRPAEFRRRLHQRLNIRLLSVQVIEIVVCLLPYAFVYFLETLLGAVGFSLTGRFPEKGDNDAERSNSHR